MSVRKDWQASMTDVLSQHRIARLALERLLKSCRLDPTLLDADLRPRDVVRTLETLEATYVVRLFAVFEAGLRSYWATLADTSPPMRDLMRGISSRRTIDSDERERADRAREYRNALIHETESASINPIEIETVGADLATFFRRLPSHW